MCVCVCVCSTFTDSAAVLRVFVVDDFLHQLVVAAGPHRLHHVLHLEGAEERVLESSTVEMRTGWEASSTVPQVLLIGLCG